MKMSKTKDSGLNLELTAKEDLLYGANEEIAPWPGGEYQTCVLRPDLSRN